MNLHTVKGVKTIFTILILLVIVAGGLLVGYPLFTQNQQFATEISEAQAEEATAKSEFQIRQNYKDTIDSVRKLDEDASEKFPTNANIPGLVSFVQKAAADAGMDSSSITDLTTGVPTISVAAAAGTDPAAAPAAAPAEGAAPAAGADPAAAAAPGAGGGNLAEMSLTIAAEGTQEELMEFVGNLTTGNRNILISSYSIDSSSGTESGAAATLRVEAKSFIYRAIEDPEATPAETAPTDGAAAPPAEAPAP